MTITTEFDAMIGEAIRVEIDRQGATLTGIDWAQVGYEAVEAYGFGPDTMNEITLVEPEK